ncbi:MAG: hypothetical protein QOJ07_61, partial [Thermoleophilaceae bacterium]|nr:hypothetical protein [Thermoleophilaceae bacterium]
VGHFGAAPPLLLDPFDGGALLRGDPPGQHLRPWSPQETAQRMLSNLIRSYSERGDVGRALHAADLRDLLPADTALREQQEHERSALMARLN